jgi:predicted permease
VANLLLARALARRREIAVRLALGVSRLRLIAQLGSESVLIAAVGGAAGLLFAQWGGTALRSFLLPGVASESIAWDRRTLIFAGAAVLVVATLVGLVPIVHAMRSRDFVGGLKAGAREGTRQPSRARAALLVLQVALSLVLLVGSGLFVRSLFNVTTLHLGYDVAPILYVQTELRNEVIPPVELAALKRRLLARAQSLPGVANAARVTTVPFYGSSSGPIFVPGLDTSVINRHGEFTRQTASPEYFATAGTRIIRGRGFTAADMRTTPRVAVVTDAMARTLWPDQDAIGKCFKTGSDTMPCTTVIGVTENVRLETLGSDSALHYYLPIEQRSPAGGGLFIRMSGDARHHAESIRRELQHLMPGTAYVTVTPFADILDVVARSWRLGAAMFTAFGALALVLSAVGLYAVIAHNVAQRTHELGVRVALGAQTPDVIRLVVGEGLRLGGAGLAVGVVIALAAAPWIAPLLLEP